MYHIGMSKIVIYHGSPRVVEEPIFNFASQINDYGYGFYCTQDIEIAKEWANRSTKNGILNSYLLDMNNLKVLDLTEPEFSPLPWITVLLAHRKLSNELLKRYRLPLEYLNRHYSLDISQFDVIIGYRADDAYFKFPLLFMDNNLTLERLEEIYKLGDLGKQLFIQSERAFSKLKYIDSKQVGKEYFYKYRDRLNAAKQKFEQIRDEEMYTAGTRLRDLMLGEKK